MAAAIARPEHPQHGHVARAALARAATPDYRSSMGTTSIDLYRSGNASGAQLDKVRISEVDTRTDPNGDTWVLAINGKGVSTWDSLDPTWRGKPWRLPASSPYDDHLLLVWEDEPGHWTWAPAHDMILGDYQVALSQVSVLFVKA
jgi:hypothetical protein